MKRLERKSIVALALIAVSGSAIAVAVTFRSNAKHPEIPQPTNEVAARFRLQAALRDASIQDLIQNARVAARKGDEKTHRAMVSGLKREPQRARVLIQNQLSRTSDSDDISILNRMISELP